MVSLVEKYVPTQPPAEPERLGDFLRDELERIAIHMAGRDEVLTGRGTTSAGTLVITFARAQPDTEFNILVATSNDGRVWSSAKAVTGFTINHSGGGAAVVHWAIFRDRDND